MCRHGMVYADHHKAGWLLYVQNESVSELTRYSVQKCKGPSVKYIVPVGSLTIKCTSGFTYNTPWFHLQYNIPEVSLILQYTSGFIYNIV